MRNFYLSIMTVGLACLSFPSVAAQKGDVTLAEFQDLMVQYSMYLRTDDLTRKMSTLTPEQWQQWYDVSPSKGELAAAVRNLGVMGPLKADSLMAPESLASSEYSIPGEFKPLYPNMDPNADECFEPGITCYGEYIAPAVALGLFDPDSRLPGLQDDRCKEKSEGQIKAAHVALHAGAIVLQATCDAAPTPFEFVSCPGAGVAWGLDYATEEIITACEAQSGNVDGAEIEAAYRNTRQILRNTDGLQELKDERRYTDDVELAAHGTAVKNVLSTHDESVNKELAKVRKQLAQQQAQLDTILAELRALPGRRKDWHDRPWTRPDESEGAQGSDID